MAKVFIQESTLTAIGDAIRSKTGKTELIDPANMSTEIASITTGGGGGGYEIPDEAFMLTGDCSYLAKGATWSWFFKLYKNKIQTKDITAVTNVFEQEQRTTQNWSGLGGFPFTFNIKNVNKFSATFRNLGLIECPKIRGSIKWDDYITFENMMYGNYMASLDDLFTSEMMEGFSNFKITSSYSCPNLGSFFNHLRNLTHIPAWWYKLKINPESTAIPFYIYLPLYGTFEYCEKLSEALKLPVLVLNSGLGMTDDQFSLNTFYNCYSLSRITFETNADGSPIVAQWKAQTIDLTHYVGYSGTTTSVGKSVYNHDSAVETINSLPDTSAYLASAGGTNTIQFRRDSGSATAGGAIGNLTEEEIAVATAKGWTVSLT